MKEIIKHLKITFLEIATVSLLLILASQSVFSAMVGSSIIHSSGQIVTLSPLHVEGSALKDVNNNTIYLRGCGKIHWDDDPTGWWWNTSWDSNYCVWDESAVRYHLKTMKSWGMNLVRFHTVAEWWLTDPIVFKDENGVTRWTGSYRNNLKRAFQIAQEEGMYVIMDLFAIKNGYYYYSNQNTQPPGCIPFTPYVRDPGEIAIFPDGKQSFVNYWANVANELKTYPNVIFELYNEPNNMGFENQTTMVRADWFDACQKAITAIRNTGSENIIEVQWWWGSAPGTLYDARLMWVEDYPLTDPENNILYSTHLYRCFYNPTWGPCYNYTECLNGMINCQFEYVVKTLNKPLIIGEMGVNMFYSGTDLQHELDWARNVLSICNQWGISYSAWDWTITDQWHLISSNGLGDGPSAWGQVLINAIAEGGTRANP